MCNGKVKRQIRVDRMKVKSKRDVEQMREREKDWNMNRVWDKKEERETETLKNGKTWKGGGEKQRENEKEADKYQEWKTHGENVKYHQRRKTKAAFSLPRKYQIPQNMSKKKYTNEVTRRRLTFVATPCSIVSNAPRTRRRPGTETHTHQIARWLGKTRAKF